MTKYSLDVVNNSTDFEDFCVYQTDPDIGIPNVQSLAWFVDGAHPTTTLDFQWTVDYSFVWDEVGMLVPGIVFRASQDWPADPSDAAANQVVFDYRRDAYTFDKGTAAGTPQVGSLYIKCSPHVPLKTASVGIGMSGAGTFAVEAEPNKNYIFTPHPTYWVTAGTYEKGEVVDTTEISNPLQVVFPPGIFHMRATYNDDNTWQLSPEV